MELSPSDELLSSKPLTGDNRKDAVMLEVFFRNLNVNLSWVMEFYLRSLTFCVTSRRIHRIICFQNCIFQVYSRFNTRVVRENILFVCRVKYKLPMKKSSGIVLAVDVHGYENRYLTVKEECRLSI
jgi:hypothetical protein